MRWNEMMDDALRTLFSNDYSDSEIADYFGFEDERTVSRRRLRLGLVRVQHKSKHNTWSPDDLKTLKETLHLTCEEVAQRLGKTREAVNSMRKRYKLKSTRMNRWSGQQLQILYQDYSKRGAHYVAEKTGMPVKRVWTKAHAEGIRRNL